MMPSISRLRPGIEDREQLQGSPTCWLNIAACVQSVVPLLHDGRLTDLYGCRVEGFYDSDRADKDKDV